jgi:hypothetical protein
VYTRRDCVYMYKEGNPFLYTHSLLVYVYTIPPCILNPFLYTQSLLVHVYTIPPCILNPSLYTQSLLVYSIPSCTKPFQGDNLVMYNVIRNGLLIW